MQINQIWNYVVINIDIDILKQFITPGVSFHYHHQKQHYHSLKILQIVIKKF